MNLDALLPANMIPPARRLFPLVVTLWFLFMGILAPPTSRPAAAQTPPAVSLESSTSTFCPPSCATKARPQDEIWVISTRRMGELNCDFVSSRQMQVMRYDGQQWLASDLETLLGSAREDQLTVIDIHGNRFTFEESLQAGWYIYNGLICQAPPTPIRLVIWSWPSDRVAGLLHDAREKAERTNSEGFYLGWFLNQLDPRSPVSLVGYSFGARIATGGLHVLGGESLVGHRLPAPVSAPRPIRTALLVAALPNHWLIPGQPHGRALLPADRLLVFYNPLDPVLKRYHLIEPFRPEALGSTGLVGLGAIGPEAMHIEQRNVAGIIGRSHDLELYYQSPYIMSQLQQFLLWQDAPLP